MLATAALGAALLLSAGDDACSVGVLRSNDNGYRYTEQQLARFVAGASAIVIATPIAVDSTSGRWSHVAHDSVYEIRFRVDEVLRGPVDTLLVLEGVPSESDDFNPLKVPYGLARRSASGRCYAFDYRLGRPYLLLLSTREGRTEVDGTALAPVNEQIRGPNDPWVAWVRSNL